MKSNINLTDRVIRILIAVVTALLYFSGLVTGGLGLTLFIAGVILLLTSLINFCPIYYALGISTKKRKVAA